MASGVTKKDSMFSVKERPWHGLGKVIQTAPSIEEGIKLAGLDWEVQTEPLYTKDKTLVPSRATSRMLNDEKIILGVVGSSYVPLQNTEAFNFFEPFVESGMVELETAGSLFEGKKVWIMAKIKDSNLKVQKNDEVERFILLSNSHDGTTAVRVGYTPVRVVCNNTLSMAHTDNNSQLIRIRHTYQVQNNVNEIRETMDIINQQFITTVEKFKYLASRDIVSADLEKYIKQVFSTKKLDEELLNDQASKENENKKSWMVEQIERIYYEGRGRELNKGTMWDAYNSVNEYLQYERGQKTTNEGRFNNLWFGDSSRLNRKALELALKY